MEKNYTINEVATMTGLTTRTIRSYLKAGIIGGEKINGIWQLSAEDFGEMLDNPAVKPSIKAKNNAVVYDFLADEKKKINKICTVIDLNVEDREAEEISQLFCDGINTGEFEDIVFKFEKRGRNVRVILSGADEAIFEIVKRYYD